jgi:hypothetical protein
MTTYTVIDIQGNSVTITKNAKPTEPEAIHDDQHDSDWWDCADFIYDEHRLFPE